MNQRMGTGRSTTASTVVVFAFDVGGKDSFGWARAEHRDDGLRMTGSCSMEKFLNAMRRDIKQGRALTLGMECPLFIPVPRRCGNLNRGRRGEGNRAVFAQAGASVATLGIHQLAFILKRIKPVGVEPVLNWKKWKPKPKTVLLWEAFVAGDAHSKTNDHIGDAATAVHSFIDRYRSGNLTSDVSVESPAGILSLVGCAVLWAGWSKDLRLLSQPVLVVKPNKQYQGEIRIL